MALGPRRECGRDISTEAAACPRCGVPEPTKERSRDTVTADSRWLELVALCRKCVTSNRYILPPPTQPLHCKRCGHALVHVEVRSVRGFVYVLSNPSIPGLVKIGRTDRPVEERAAELSRDSGVLEPFEIEAYFAVDDADTAENEVHRALSVYRKPDREFFLLDVKRAIGLVEEAIGHASTYAHPRWVRELEPAKELDPPGAHTSGDVAALCCGACGSHWVLKLEKARKFSTCPRCESALLKLLSGPP